MSSKHIIKFNLKGGNARPDKIGMGELGDLLKHIEAAIRAAVPIGDRISHLEDSDPLVSLVSLQEGNSVDMGAAILDYGIPAFSEICLAIENDSFNGLEVKSHEEINRVSNWVVRRRLELEIEPDEQLGINRISISKEHPVPSPSAPDFTVDGQTTAWGFLTQVGGVKPRAALLFPDKSKVIISADEIVTKQLGERLYEDVGIEGIARWRIRDWKMTSFKAIRLLDYRPQTTDVAQTFKDLSVASEGRFDDINAEDYLKELRGE
jgi:hypothetical protein